MLHLVFVCGKVVAIRRWVTMTDGSEWPEDKTRVKPWAVGCLFLRVKRAASRATDFSKDISPNISVNPPPTFPSLYRSEKLRRHRTSWVGWTGLLGNERCLHQCNKNRLHWPKSIVFDFKFKIIKQSKSGRFFERDLQRMAYCKTTSLTSNNLIQRGGRLTWQLSVFMPLISVLNDFSIAVFPLPSYDQFCNELSRGLLWRKHRTAHSLPLIHMQTHSNIQTTLTYTLKTYC